MNARPDFRAFVDPVHGIAGPVIEMPRPEKATLADLIQMVPLQTPAIRPHLRVMMNGEWIDPANYHLIRPKDNTYISLHLPVHGGGGKKSGIGKVLSVVAGIALLGASLFVGGFGIPGIFAAGSMGAKVAAAGLSLAASMLMQGLQPETSTPSEDKDNTGFASAQNAFEPGAYLNRVIGTRRVAPQHAIPPWTEVVGDDQYVYACYALSGRHAISDIFIGNTEITDTDDTEVEIREGTAADSPLTLITNTVIEKSLGIQMSTFRVKPDENLGDIIDESNANWSSIWHRMETKLAPDKAKLFLTFDRGLADEAGTTALVDIRVRIRKSGTTTWYNLPEFTFKGKRPSKPIRAWINFLWTAPGSMPASSTAFSVNSRGFAYKWNLLPVGSGTQWSADAYFRTTRPHAVTWISPQEISVYLDTNVFPKDGSYEIEVRRSFPIHDHDANSNLVITKSVGAFGTITFDDMFTPKLHEGELHVLYDSDKMNDSLVIAMLQSIYDEYPFDLDGQPTTLIAIKARNRSIDNMMCTASGYVANWNGSTWLADQISSNPASWYRHVLMEDLNPSPVPASLVDEDNLVEWHQWCQTNGYEVNAIIKGQPVTEVLSIIAQAGFARPRYSATHGVIIDKPREGGPVGIITQRNAGGFSFSKPFARMPHALKVSFANEDDNYEIQETTVYAPGYNSDGSGGLTEASRFESVTYPGITDQLQAEARADRDIRFGKYRSRLINFSMDIEHLEFQLGDLVLLETDILGQIGGRGRIKQINEADGLITSVVLDEAPNYAQADANGWLRGIGIRLSNGAVRVEAVTGDNTENTVTFLHPFAMPTDGSGDLIKIGTLVATGVHGMEARQALIWDIAPGPDLTANITALDYAEQSVYRTLTIAAGTGAFVLSGKEVRFAGDVQIAANTGAFVLAGQGMNFLRQLRMDAAAGSFTVAGQDTVFATNFLFGVDAGVFALAGGAADFVDTVLIEAGVGTFALAGQDANLFIQWNALVANGGSFTIGGQDATFRFGYTIFADVGTLAIAGQSADLLASRRFIADSGAFLLAGQAVEIEFIKLLLSGDMQGGEDHVLLSGDMQSGSDELLLSGDMKG